MDRDTKRAIGKFVIFLLIVGGVLTGILLPLSYETVDANDYGLKQHWFTKKIDPTPVRGIGTHYVGIQYDYIRFPATWQTVEFSPASDADDIAISTQTKDGLAITFDASFQYKLRSEGLYDIYSQYGLTYNDQIVQVARGALRNTASQFSATEFLQNRSIVADAMKLDLNISIIHIQVDIEAFQLRQITLPQSFMDATEQVEVAKLQQTIAQYELEAAQIAAQIDIVEAQTAANVSLIQAYAAANVTEIDANAQANALNITMSMESYTMADFMNTTGMNASEAIAFFYVQALENLPEGTTLVLTDFVSLLLGTG